MNFKAALFGLLGSLALGAGVVSCGDDDDGGGSTAGGGTSGTGGASGGAAGSGGSTGGSAGTDAGATVTFSGTVTEFSFTPGTTTPIADVQICLSGSTTPPCTKTDASGKYTWPGLPANTEGAALFTKTGYASVAVVGVTETADETIDATMPTEAVAQTFATAAGFTWPLAGKSIIGFAAVEDVASDAGADAGTVATGVAGATVSISPSGGKGPVYLNASDLPDQTATATSSAGAGFFGDLPPGEYTIKVTSPSGKTCTRAPQSGWAAASADSIKVPAIADFVISAVRFVCK